MRFINKFSLILFILIGSMVKFLFLEEYRQIYQGAFLTITAFLVGVLIYKYKCVNLIAGFEAKEDNVENASVHIGRLMFFIAFLLGIGTLLSLFVDGVFNSWYALFFTVPIIVYALYCLVKINQT